MSKPLRLMIYDAKPGRGLGQYLLMLAWRTGGWFMKLVGRVDDYRGFTSWYDALAWLALRGGKIAEVQFWGHSSPGRAVFAGHPLDMLCLVHNHPMHPILEAFANRLTETSLVWFRSCSILQGDHGQLFAQHLAARLDCVIAGHTRMVGLTHGGLHTIRPGEKPSWSATEGEPPGRIAGYLKWGPNTIWFFQSKIPHGW